ncbi:hypothetical protein M3699_26450 [Peribacillus simplex]|uniref:hypothetical protein n=1 Tax=Peribacillus simplex TaxID=1478 RepID=UPI00203B879E|nr:hypothetical protein [Peribacillus simplex]MCM3677234.1 hypothetical protein [Peribacillus simplex]
MVARNIEVEKETAITTAATQQQPENELKQYTLQLQIALEQMSATMQIIATFSFYSSLHKAPYWKLYKLKRIGEQEGTIDLTFTKILAPFMGAFLC